VVSLSLFAAASRAGVRAPPRHGPRSHFRRGIKAARTLLVERPFVRQTATGSPATIALYHRPTSQRAAFERRSARKPRVTWTTPGPSPQGPCGVHPGTFAGLDRLRSVPRCEPAHVLCAARTSMSRPCSQIDQGIRTLRATRLALFASPPLDRRIAAHLSEAGAGDNYLPCTAPGTHRTLAPSPCNRPMSSRQALPGSSRSNDTFVRSSAAANGFFPHGYAPSRFDAVVKGWGRVCPTRGKETVTALGEFPGPESIAPIGPYCKLLGRRRRVTVSDAGIRASRPPAGRAAIPGGTRGRHHVALGEPSGRRAATPMVVDGVVTRHVRSADSAPAGSGRSRRRSPRSPVAR
jgi:hypothetical protein